MHPIIPPVNVSALMLSTISSNQCFVSRNMMLSTEELTPRVIENMASANHSNLPWDLVRQHLHNTLKVSTLRGVAIKTLDKALQNHDDWALDGFLLWLQDQVAEWSNSTAEVYRPKIQAFCDRLRNRHFKARLIIKSFQLWKTNQLQAHQSIQSLMCSIEDILVQYLHRAKKTKSLNLSKEAPSNNAKVNTEVLIDNNPKLPKAPVDHLDESHGFEIEDTNTMGENEASEIASSAEGRRSQLVQTRDTDNHPIGTSNTKEINSSFDGPPFSNYQDLLALSHNHRELSKDHRRDGKVESVAEISRRTEYICHRRRNPGKHEYLWSFTDTAY